MRTSKAMLLLLAREYGSDGCDSCGDYGHHLKGCEWAAYLRSVGGKTESARQAKQNAERKARDARYADPNYKPTHVSASMEAIANGLRECYGRELVATLLSADALSGGAESFPFIPEPRK